MLDPTKIQIPPDHKIDPLEKVFILQPRLKPQKDKFIKASVWYLELVRELDEEIINWQGVAKTAFEKGAHNLGAKYLGQAENKKCQKGRIIKFYNLCERIIDQCENDLQIKEDLESLMIIQAAADKRGLKIDILKTLTKIYKGTTDSTDSSCQ